MLLAILAAAACVDPASYGAAPDDRTDDAPAIQRAIDHAIQIGADVCIGPGIWNLGKPDGPGSLTITGGPIVLRGSGPKTILRMSGPGHRRSWRAIYVKGGHGVVIRDLTIDGLDATDTEEQTHLIELGPDTRGAIIARVTLGPMRRPEQKVGEGIGGDCIRLLGEPGHEVANVTIADDTLIDCDRSGIAVQRAVHDVAIVHDTISGTGDSAIDFEPTGRGAIDSIALVELTIHHATAQSTWAITLTGTDDDFAHRITLARSTIDGGGVSLLNVFDAELADNDITGHPRGGDRPVISVFRRGDRIRITHNKITRPATADPGFVIRAAHNNGGVPKDIVIEANQITQATAYPVIGSLSAGGLVVRDNTIDYAGKDAGAAIVQVDPQIADVAGVTVEGNDVRGTAGSLLTLSMRAGRALSAVSVRGNRGSHLAALRCHGPTDRLSAIRLDQPVPDSCHGADIQSSRQPTANPPP